ncbi:hypothetical protein UFOVP225_63 [uncultured Caudovirales phage]|uniref:Uncharacterized protein n=1 Tax=uncultured Caudovirales phage TaxID=2100421 RepID=A0A6J5L566_9CAUD|nr:hypothetical protein UFOVP113_76 [uncultured Caudovirales phage]CAB5219385.1 hypothetical protein UFOVP225_63 [uncultured Caudovirales phage]
MSSYTAVDTWSEIQASEIELGKVVRIERTDSDGEPSFRIEGTISEVNKVAMGPDAKVAVRFATWGYSPIDLHPTDRVFLIGQVIHHI